jgi:hypothetical protein
MLKTLSFAVMLIAITASAALAQSRTMYIGDVELRLGMSQDAAMKLLSKYQAIATATGSIIRECNQTTKLCNVLGSVAAEKGQVIYISRSLDTSTWPADEGFSVARALYGALNGSISKTESDGAKRTNATIVISNQDADKPVPMNIRTIYIYVDDRRIILTMTDGADGRQVGAQVEIRSKPW